MLTESIRAGRTGRPCRVDRNDTPVAAVAVRARERVFRALAAGLWLVLGVSPTGVAHARELSITAARIVANDIRAERFALRLAPASAAQAHLTIDDLDVPALGLAGQLDWSCTLEAQPSGGSSCSGPVQLRSGADSHDARLSLRVDAGTASIELARGSARAQVRIPFDAALPFTFDAQSLPSDWLRAPLRAAAPDFELRTGTLGIQARIARDGALEAAFDVEGLTCGSGDGATSVTQLSAHGRATFATGPDRHLVAQARFDAGTLRVGELAVVVPASAIEADIDATFGEQGRVDITRFAWRDPDALEFEASGLLDLRALAPLRRLDVSAASLRFPLVRERYADALFRRHGLDGLALAGTIRGSVDVDEHGLRRLTLATDALDVRDAAHALRIDALAGGIDWRGQGIGNVQRIGWRKATFGTLALAATHADWRSRDGRFELVSPLRVDAGHGTLELRGTVLDPLATTGERLRTRFTARGFGYDDADGTVAVSGLSATGSLSLGGTDTQLDLRAQARIDGGEVLYGATYVRLPEGRVDAGIDATLAGERLRVTRLEWNDPGTLELSVGFDARIGDGAALQAVQADVRRLDLASALPRYAASWLATKGWPELSGNGTLSGTLQTGPDGLQAFALAASGVSIVDGAHRFAVDGLDGALDWNATSDRPPTAFGWQRLELLQVPFGAARFELASRAAAIELAQPLAVDVLGGQLRFERFTAQPRSPRGERFAGSFALAGLQMPLISQVFGWPQFPGNLSGGVPEIEFVGDRVEFHGGLDLYVFDGHLGVSGLVLERPFGVAPALQADVHFENMDLEQLTRAFSFGGMTGRLFGTIADLRLIDWSPVAFDAWLRTNGGGRMSYKAVNDLTSIGGGGGLGASLQTMALKVFDTFGYRQLGLRCRLVDEVCAMAGIAAPPADAGGSSAAGYTIVEGSGIPRIMIVGHRRRVDWPTLVRRLAEATRGQAPVIE